MTDYQEGTRGRCSGCLALLELVHGEWHEVVANEVVAIVHESEGEVIV